MCVGVSVCDGKFVYKQTHGRKGMQCILVRYVNQAVELCPILHLAPVLCTVLSGRAKPENLKMLKMAISFIQGG